MIEYRKASGPDWITVDENTGEISTDGMTIPHTVSTAASTPPSVWAFSGSSKQRLTGTTPGTRNHGGECHCIADNNQFHNA